MPELLIPPGEVEEKNEGDTPTAKPMVGIIYPPPEVRNIVDKTAGFVARNGPEFESRIRQNEISNAKFNFLNPGDPYHAYYRHKVKDFQEGKPSEMQLIIAPKSAPSQPSSKPVVQVSEPIVPKEPPPDYEFVADPPSISAFELDVVKLTAQFVARNGRQFLTNLMNREQRNYLFDFLRPQHSMFNYFTKLVEQYTKVLIPPKDLPSKLHKESVNTRSVMDKVQYRVTWEKHQEMQRQKEQEQKEKERAAYASIDWHDFVVVETVDFQPGEQGNFPPPLKPDDIGVRILAEERIQQFGEDEVSEEEEEEEEEDVQMEVEDDEEEEEEDEDEDVAPGTEKEKVKGETLADQNTEVQDMEEGDSDMEESDEEEESPMPPPPKEGTPMPPPPLPPQLGEVQIRKDYDPKTTKTAPVSDDNFLISPITGEKIPADKMQEHMRIGLLDPHWIEQRNRQLAEKRAEESVFAPGVAIEESLKNLAERRTDIFGEGDVETQIGKKIGEEEDTSVKQKVIWDGHTASMEATTRKAQANISIEEQIAALHKAKGLLPDKEKEKIGPQPKQGVNIPPPRHHHQQQQRNFPMSKPMPRLPPPPQPPAPPKPIAPPPAPPAVPSMMQRRMQVMPGRGPPLMGVNPGGMMQVRPRPPVPMMQPRPQFVPGPPMGMPRMRPPMQPPMGMPGMPPRMPPPMPMMGGDDGPPNKKVKTEESLIPEDLWLARNKGPITFRVAVPPLPDKPEWKCNGQLLTFTLPITDQVSVIKAKIFEQLMMPAGKQKLQYEGLFIKDSNSLAFYNFMNNSIIQLGLKERGGRKR